MSNSNDIFPIREFCHILTFTEISEFVTNLRLITWTRPFKTILYLSIFDSKENLQLPQSILRTGDLQPENIESLALHAISLILLPGLMRSCNTKNHCEESATVLTSARQ